MVKKLFWSLCPQTPSILSPSGGHGSRDFSCKKLPWLVLTTDLVQGGYQMHSGGLVRMLSRAVNHKGIPYTILTNVHYGSLNFLSPQIIRFCDFKGISQIFHLFCRKHVFNFIEKCLSLPLYKGRQNREQEDAAPTFFRN